MRPRPDEEKNGDSLYMSFEQSTPVGSDSRMCAKSVGMAFDDDSVMCENQKSSVGPRFVARNSRIRCSACSL